jgi:hypothetical protein
LSKAPPSFSPFETLATALHGWWLVAALIITGGGAGWALNSTRAPIYESQGSISVTIDFTRTGALDDAEEDWTMGVVGDLIHSTAVLDQTEEQAARLDIVVEAAARVNTFFVERRDNLWVLRVRSSSPEAAQRLAGIWLKNALTSLDESKRQALTAEKLNRYLDSITGCLQQSVVIEPAQAGCTITDLTHLQQELTITGGQLEQATRLSRGISPALTYNLKEEPFLPTSPVLHSQNTSILAGALVGFLVAVMMFQANLTAWLQPHKKQ